MKDNNYFEHCFSQLSFSCGLLTIIFIIEPNFFDRIMEPTVIGFDYSMYYIYYIYYYIDQVIPNAPTFFEFLNMYSKRYMIKTFSQYTHKLHTITNVIRKSCGLFLVVIKKIYLRYAAPSRFLSFTPKIFDDFFFLVSSIFRSARALLSPLLKFPPPTKLSTPSKYFSPFQIFRYNLNFAPPPYATPLYILYSFAY